MSIEPIPIPDYLSTSSAATLHELQALALELFQRLADGARRLENCERKAKDEFASQTRDNDRMIARLAAERFEFQRLLDRMLPQIEQSELPPDLAKALSVQARGWDAELQRMGIEVIDLAGQILTDALSEKVEVESAIPDPNVEETVVRKTLTPLVLHEGRVVGAAKVNTSVPKKEGSL
jgi:hypothetical protein